MNITDGSGLENNHTIYTNPQNISPYRLGWGMGTDLNRWIYIYCDIYVIHFLNNIISRNWGCSRNEKCAWKNISDISQTCKHNFPGDEEFSEPETRAVRVGILFFIYPKLYIPHFLSLNVRNFWMEEKVKSWYSTQCMLQVYLVTVFSIFPLYCTYRNTHTQCSQLRASTLWHLISNP